jgi:hypothetical protein
MSTDTQAAIQLNPTLQALAERVTDICQEAERLTQGLSPAQRLWSPDPEHWSIAQCLDHLNKVGYPLLSRFEAAIQQLEAQGLRSDGPFHYSRLERWFIRLLSPDPPMKVPVPKIFIPAATPEALTDTVPRFLELQAALLQCIHQANGLALTQVRISSVANPLLRLSLGAYLEATIGHEQYHLLQAQAIRNHPDFPPSPQG